VENKLRASADRNGERNSNSGRIAWQCWRHVSQGRT